MREKISKKVKIVGNILSLIAIGYIVNLLNKSEINIENILSASNIKLFLISLLLQCIVIVCSSIPWRILVCFLADKEIDKRKVSFVFLKANILKYLPGNFFHYVGRNQIAFDYELHHMDVFLATMIDMALGLGAGVLFSFIFFKEMLYTYISESIIIFVVCIIVGVFLLNIIKKKQLHIFESLFKFFKISGMKIIVKVIIYYCIQNMATIIIVMIVGLCITGEYTLSQLVLMGCGYIFASVVGTLTPGSPAGIGVRESVMVVICQTFLYEDILALTIIMRIISTLGDFLTFLLIKFCYVGRK